MRSPLWHKGTSLRPGLYSQTLISHRETFIVRLPYSTVCSEVCYSLRLGMEWTMTKRHFISLVLSVTRMKKHETRERGKDFTPLSSSLLHDICMCSSSCKHGTTWLQSLLLVNSGMQRGLLRRFGRLLSLNSHQ